MAHKVPVMDVVSVRHAYRRWAPIYDFTFGLVAEAGRSHEATGAIMLSEAESDELLQLLFLLFLLCGVVGEDGVVVVPSFWLRTTVQQGTPAGTHQLGVPGELFK